MDAGCFLQTIYYPASFLLTFSNVFYKQISIFLLDALATPTFNLIMARREPFLAGTRTWPAEPPRTSSTTRSRRSSTSRSPNVPLSEKPRVASSNGRNSNYTTNRVSHNPHPPHHSQSLPLHNGHNDPRYRARSASRQPKRSYSFIRPEGESGRNGINPWKLLKISFMSSCFISRIVNVLWPVVPAAIAMSHAAPDRHMTIFILAYIAMVPCANLVGFAGQELSRKFSHVFGVVTETT